MAKECDQPRNPATMTCRNCDQRKLSTDFVNKNAANVLSVGHMSKECPKPRDYSKVKCSNCDQSKSILFKKRIQKRC
jgi:hypothetical protein